MSTELTELVAKIPGKVLLCGEYCLLTRGSRSISFAVDSYLEVYVRYGKELRESLTLNSNLWDEPRQIDTNTDHDDMLIGSVCELMPAGEHRVEEIAVTSQLDPRHGFGSSSALYLALSVIAFLQQRATNLVIPPAKRWQLAGRAFKLQKKRQGLASGYDIATQFIGGIVDYHSRGGEWPYRGEARPLQGEYEIVELYNNLTKIVHIFVGGQGADTSTVVRDTMKWIGGQGDLPMITKGTELQQAFSEALDDLDKLPALTRAIGQWRDWFAGSPHFPKHIDRTLRSVVGLDRKWSWKTSGAGGEDALIVIGHREDITGVSARLAEQGWQPFDYEIAEHGLQLHRIGE